MCGVFGIFGHEEAANLTYLGLHAQQHRGQEAAGLTASDGSLLRGHKGQGLVADVFNEQLLSQLTGKTNAAGVVSTITGMRWLGFISRKASVNWSPCPMFTGTTL